jgi:DHA1 family bicyclomycin/chloramphenicol resistance-like MFS transporter
MSPPRISEPIAHGSAAYYRFGIILGALTAMGPLAIDMYLPSFPTIAREFGSTTAAVEATAAAYFTGMAVGQSLYGPISDRLGRKLPLYAGLVLFVAASIGCAFAPSVPALLTLRFVQALGGCAQIVIARAMVRDLFDERDSMRVLSLLILVMGVAPILAPLLGGQLLVTFGWRSVFWVLAGYALACMAAVSALVPETLAAPHRRRDSLMAVGRIYGRLLRDRSFMAQALSGSLTIAGMFAYIAGSATIFIQLFRVPADRFGLFFGTNAIGLIAASQINGRLAARMPAHTILAKVFPVTAVAALVLLADALTGFGGFAGILVPLFVCVASVGFVVPNTTVLAMAPHGQVAGSASALLGTLQFAVGAVAAFAVSTLNNGTAVPLGAVIACCAVGAFLTSKAA